MNNRIKQIRKNSDDKTLEKFGNRIGISGAAMSQIENGKTTPTNQTIKAICQYYNVNEEWLRSGEGEPYRALTNKEMLTDFFADILNEDDGSFKAQLIEILAQLDENGWRFLADFARKLTK